MVGSVFRLLLVVVFAGGVGFGENGRVVLWL
jgi:hypothetical protein